MECLGTRGQWVAIASAWVLVLRPHPLSAQKADDAFARAESLDRKSLVVEVLRRNPSSAAALAGWRVAQARAAQEGALDDPMLTYGIAPLSIASDSSFGQTIQLEQRFPWPGKLRLAGDVALAEAAAAKEQWKDTKLRLALTASALFDDWYVVHRALQINAQHIELVKALKKSAEAQYSVGKASQEDVLQAESELAHVEYEAVALSAQREITRVQINGLLHRLPQAALPPPPTTIDVSTAPPKESEALQDSALAGRPDLLGMRAQIDGSKAAVSLAERRYYPDLGVMASYNSMWMETPHQFMVGVSINLPIYLGKRHAAVDEASAARARAESNLARGIDDVRVEVETARQRLSQALRIHRLFQTRLVPVAKDRIVAANTALQTGSTSFLAVMEAARNLRTIELQAETALVDVQRRRAELDSVVGVMPVVADREHNP